MKILHQNDIVNIIGKRLDDENIKKKNINLILKMYYELCKEQLKKNGSFKIFDIGKINVIQKGKRVGRNPKNGEKIMIEPRKGLKFIASRKIKFK
jgi:integration host factor subunit alpha